jgi:tRNA/rRNA methyltransferase
MRPHRAVRVILVNTRYRGNLGFVCRAMANFGLDELWLVSPRARPDSHEAQEKAVYAREILARSRVVSDLSEALAGVDLAVGSTARSNPGTDRKRAALSPGELSSLLPIDGLIGLVFGPEENGLSKEDLERMDLLVTIPCSEDYRSMNLSHAAAILFYEVTRPALNTEFQRCRPATTRLIGDGLKRVAARVSLRDRTAIGHVIDTWLGRSILSEPEANAILALVRQAEEHIGPRAFPPGS